MIRSFITHVFHSVSKSVTKPPFKLGRWRNVGVNRSGINSGYDCAEEMTPNYFSKYSKEDIEKIEKIINSTKNKQN